MPRKQLVKLQVPSILVQLKRWTVCVLLSIVWDAFTILLILGEGVFWKLNLVETIYTNMASNPADLFVTVWVTGQMLILALFILWNIGLLGYLRDWADANL